MGGSTFAVSARIIRMRVPLIFHADARGASIKYINLVSLSGLLTAQRQEKMWSRKVAKQFNAKFAKQPSFLNRFGREKETVEKNLQPNLSAYSSLSLL